jgi:hypothetical protein
MARDSSDVEEVFNAARSGEMLNLGGAMLRRYAATYEALSGEEITIHKREGRLFTQEQVDVLLKARSLVTTQGLSVRAAMQLALSGDSDIALRSAERASQALLATAVEKDAGAFAEAVRDAVQDGNKELVEEMRLLRARLESNSNLEHNVRTPALQERPDKHGPFVRFALWVEGLFGK